MKIDKVFWSLASEHFLIHQVLDMLELLANGFLGTNFNEIWRKYIYSRTLVYCLHHINHFSLASMCKIFCNVEAVYLNVHIFPWYDLNRTMTVVWPNVQDSDHCNGIYSLIKIQHHGNGSTFLLTKMGKQLGKGWFLHIYIIQGCS